ncbi:MULTISPECIES: Maf family nucleotide pyrophosphatase [unclassified Luteimonas]|uniref:Maf family nucleotide pyrophosphatase n=1 Tax=unclassified Luteimonas TaxID=2629088 RepID=UPI001600F306|nr:MULTISPECIES: Maf family nucleotide pyrophosphatase [unclassified Luteimonas]MBB1471508.1 septum formation protein Maf [Luteimonas sp. MC1782]MBB6599753.1 septum formation protein Maf [Luteimonas sp. MC1825]QOC87432.1 septum formation protein Maf [Luteimonas sp. MC1825]
MPAPAVVLASTSPYRRELLARLRLPFESVRPEVDETPRPGESPALLAMRLACAKAAAVAATHPDACVVGSDQVAELDGRPIGKAGGRDAAIAQLLGMASREVVFHTAVAVAAGGAVHAESDTTRVRLRALDIAAITRYVDAEQPWDCAGSFKCEGYGITLFEAIDSTDPTALVGLPLIATARLLRAAGCILP